ncbi:transposase [Dictyobacter formicarum]|uniref:Transposase IS200-like domain-containing protein n=1 Tax=Dictyobacter formicarum TaxID=2778368 RepID=A0ABQ3VJN2_9CHLR|nr:transposase [Dictyobacter formicarum]GHO85894.1 hypothetical protein KSZ_39000 [Dictyobacter formicarum]
MENLNNNNAEMQRAKTLHLADYDYRQPGAYAITICAWKRRWLFQHPVLRAILYKEWKNLQQHYIGIIPGVIMIMHNHLHCILIIESNQPEVKSVIEIIGGYKSIVSNAWYAYVKECNGHYPMKLWQKRFYDHIIRDQRDFDAQTAYILNNPAVFKAKRKKINARKKNKPT